MSLSWVDEASFCSLCFADGEKRPREMPHPAPKRNFLVKSGVKCKVKCGVSQLWFGQGFEAELSTSSTKSCSRDSGNRFSSPVRKRVVFNRVLLVSYVSLRFSPAGYAGMRVREIHPEIKTWISIQRQRCCDRCLILPGVSWSEQGLRLTACLVSQKFFISFMDKYMEFSAIMGLAINFPPDLHCH